MRTVQCLVALACGLPLLLSGCSTVPDFVAKYEPWREDEEQACLNSGAVHQTAYLIQARSALGGPSFCGAVRPFEMAAADGGRVTLQPAAMLRCPMIPQVEKWVRDVVGPAARYYFGVPVVEIKVAGSYSCRAMNHRVGARLSEHGYANAIDIGGFVLADGRKIMVKDGWNGTRQEQAFLRDVHKGGCKEFTTVLGPEYDALHRDHFHLDLARHGLQGLKQICK